jgi:hypothetical protein
MVLGAGLVLPNTLLLVLHVVGLVLGAWLARTAWKKWQGKMKNLAFFFGAFALSELLYVTAHAGWTAVSFAHQVGQIFMWAGLVIVVWSLAGNKKQ